jgi:hypothetical protein
MIHLKNSLSLLKKFKESSSLENRNILSYCIDDPNTPYTGARGKGTVKFLEDIEENIPLVKNIL